MQIKFFHRNLTFILVLEVQNFKYSESEFSKSFGLDSSTCRFLGLNTTSSNFVLHLFQSELSKKFTIKQNLKLDHCFLKVIVNKNLFEAWTVSCFACADIDF